MRVAALYDVHGNLPALEAVLDDVRRLVVDRIVVGGDVVPGPMPREALDCLLGIEIPTAFIHGNGDREVQSLMAGVETEWYRSAPEAARESVHWSAAQLAPEHQRLLAGWPPTFELEIPGLGKVLFCHATPRNDTDIFTRLTVEERLQPLFDEAGAELVVCGHTHMQFDRRIGATRVVNAGSVGMPFGQHGAYWLLLGPEPELRRTAYDLEATAERIRATGFPQASEFAARSVLDPPSEAEMLERFGGIGGTVMPGPR